jgi:predicted protein tyrosine phosphatase
MFDVSKFKTNIKKLKVEFLNPVEPELFYKFLGLDTDLAEKAKTFLVPLEQEAIETAIEVFLFEILEDGSNQARIFQFENNKWKQVYWTSI